MLMVRPRLRPEQGANGPQPPFFRKLPGGGLWKTESVLIGPTPFGNLSILPGYNGAVAFLIRDLKPEDFETLWRMDQECFPPGISYSKQELKAYVRRRGSFTLVAANADEGKIAGFIVVQDGSTAHVITIDVDTAARRLGVGSLLLRAAEDRLRAEGSRAVGLETAVDNVAALSFYKRHGYSVIRTWPRYYSNGVDALVMKKELSSG
jgi:[ribosomal protein S18]-alanine N-acetyltransferase